MSENAVTDHIVTTASVESPAAPPVALSDLLVEDVSIDGMCGVY